ncbi:MAG TPA: V-type ATPase subunit [Candidatus Hydrogenedentes bacterium]|nr:V-type ATPase subunit [Candidatus Hydrogenedentota bacterium]
MIALTKGQSQWGFACGRISVLTGQLMPYDYYLALAGLERVEEMFHRLQDTSLREHMFPGAITWEDWSTIIDAYVDDLIASLRHDCPEPVLADMFALSEDYLNLKRAVLNRTPFQFVPRVFSEARLLEVASGTPNLLPDVIRPAVAQLTALGADAQDLATVDLVLDGAYLRHYLALARGVNAPMVLSWATERVLNKAISALWRAVRAGMNRKELEQRFLPIDGINGILKDMLEAGDPQSWGNIIPGRLGDVFREAFESPEEERITRFEHLASNYLTEMARLTKLQTMGPERVAGFLWGLWVEAFNMKLVISGKLNHIDSEALKIRVRETYV